MEGQREDNSQSHRTGNTGLKAQPMTATGSTLK